MADHDEKKLHPEMASLVVDWRSLEQELGELGTKLTDLRGQGEIIGETTLRDIEHRYEELSKHLVDVKEKTYDRLLESEPATDNTSQGGLLRGMGDAVQAAKRQAGEVGEQVLDVASATNEAVRSRIADLGESVQVQRGAAAEKIADVTQQVTSTGRNVADESLARWRALKSDIESAYQRIASSSGGEIARVNRETAKSDPEREFQAPAEIVENAGLTKAEKITALENWGFQVRQRLDAASEGMTADGSSGSTSKDAELLRDIDNTLDAVKGD